MSSFFRFDSKVLGPLSLMSYVVSQFVCTMLVRTARTESGSYAFEPTALIFVSLSIRLSLAVTFAIVNVGATEALAQWRALLPTCFAFALPSAMYLLYDQFYFWTFRWAEPVSWMALSSSLKVVLTAVFVRRVFGTRFDLRTVGPLAAMSLGAFLVEYDPRFTLQHPPSFYMVFLAGLSLNCFAGVLQEAAFKTSMQSSIHVQNSFVYVFMLLSNVMTYAVLGSWQRDASVVDESAHLFTGIGWLVFAICISEALAGLSMSYVSKVYSSISKVFASSFNMALVSAAGAVLFDAPVTVTHVAGIAMISGALYVYQRDAKLHSDSDAAGEPQKKQQEKQEKKAEVV